VLDEPARLRAVMWRVAARCGLSSDVLRAEDRDAYEVGGGADDAMACRHAMQCNAAMQCNTL
jgi:hypothetical protein